MSKYIQSGDAIFRDSELVYDGVDRVNGQRIIDLLETIDVLESEVARLCHQQCQMLPRAKVAAALTELRAEMVGTVISEYASIDERVCAAQWRDSLDATTAALNLTAEKISSRDEILASVAELKDSMTEQEKTDLHAATLGLASERTGKTDNPTHPASSTGGKMAEVTREQMCEDLARAMGWTRDNGLWCDPLSDEWRYAFPPNPFTSAEDSRALLLWMAEDDTRWVKFYYALEDALRVIVGDLTFERGRRVMTADLPVIAEAAWRAIQEKQ